MIIGIKKDFHVSEYLICLHRVNPYNIFIIPVHANLYGSTCPAHECTGQACQLLQRNVIISSYDGSFSNASCVCGLLFYDVFSFYRKACLNCFNVIEMF